MLSWGLRVFRYPVYSSRTYGVFSYHNKGSNLFFLSASIGCICLQVKNFSQVDQFVEVAFASLKYKLKEPHYAFSANCAFHEPKKNWWQKNKKITKNIVC